MTWVLVFFLLPVVLFSLVVFRVIRLVRRFHDPEQLRSLLSDEARAAILEAGLEPDSISMQAIQENEQLSRLVAADLRRALRPLILGLRLSQPGRSRDAASLPSGHDSAAPMYRSSTGAFTPARQPFLPAPIDQSSGSGRRAIVALAVVGLLAVAIFVASSQP